MQYTAIPELITGEVNEVRSVARRKARYGHRTWVSWKRDGILYAAPATVQSIKAALLARGTKGEFVFYSPNGWKSGADWKMGCGMLRRAKAGGYERKGKSN